MLPNDRPSYQISGYMTAICSSSGDVRLLKFDHTLSMEYAPSFLPL